MIPTPIEFSDEKTDMLRFTSINVKLVNKWSERELRHPSGSLLQIGFILLNGYVGNQKHAATELPRLLSIRSSISKTCGVIILHRCGPKFHSPGQQNFHLWQVIYSTPCFLFHYYFFLCCDSLGHLFCQIKMYMTL